MFNVGDKIYHKDTRTIFGFVTEVEFPGHPGQSRAKWYSREYEDMNDLTLAYGYYAVESSDKWILVKPFTIDYNELQNGDTDEDI